VNTLLVMIKSRLFLFPYWLTLKIRHWMYDTGRFKSRSFPIPIICIGNITVGGTGKTPHTEMLIEMLSRDYNIAVLSRGYKRKSKGFYLLSENDTAQMCGDEPLQIKQKFPQVAVAVCEDRCTGIEKLMEMLKMIPVEGKWNPSAAQNYVINGKEWVILLDDAFQHRKVKPTLNILLVEWNRPICNDNLLPIGELRDLPEQKRRAQIVIVTKSPQMDTLEGIYNETYAQESAATQEKIWRKRLNLNPEQKIFFSSINYGEPEGVFQSECNTRYKYSKEAIAFSGIAKSSSFVNHIELNWSLKKALVFADHRNFGQKDIKSISQAAKNNPLALVITTEKDSKRLLSNRYVNKDLKEKLFYLPIKSEILSKEARDEFKEILISTINSN